MMNPTEIADALDTVAKAKFDPVEFGYSFAQATDNAQATVAKLKAGTTNKSDIPGGVLLNAKFHYAPALPGMAAEMLDSLRASKRTAKAKPAILIATDGEMIAAEHPKSGKRYTAPFWSLVRIFRFSCRPQVRSGIGRQTKTRSISKLPASWRSFMMLC